MKFAGNEVGCGPAVLPIGRIGRDRGNPQEGEQPREAFVEIGIDAGEDDEALRGIRKKIRAAIAKDAGQVLRYGQAHRAAATSKTFRSLARICGAAASDEGPLTPRSLPLSELREWIPKLVGMSEAELAALPGVSPSRTHQIVPGALVAEACMDIFDLPALEICPWALREGVILERIDQMRVADDV